jgi:DNA-binding beta-propeller fold protein YncE
MIAGAQTMKKLNQLFSRRIPSGRLPLLLLLAALLAACSGPKVVSDRKLQWPPPPEAPQIAWVSEISDYTGAGISKGWWTRVVDFVAGESDNRMGRPYGVYVDVNGRIFVVDTVFKSIHVMDTVADKYTVIEQPNKSAVFLSPIGITGDDAGNVYVTDSLAGNVYRYSIPDNTVTTFCGALERPTGIAFNKRNRMLYVSDTTADRVVVFDGKGMEKFHIGKSGAAPGEFNHPTDLFIDTNGTLYVTDPLNARIQLFSTNGDFIRAIGSAGDDQGEFFKPKGVAADSSGNIYVVDALSDTVKVFDKSGRFRLEFGSRGVEAGMLWLPSGLDIDTNDNIYVADTYNRRIQKFRRILPASTGNKGEVTK